MKKITLIVCALATTVASFATVQPTVRQKAETRTMISPALKTVENTVTMTERNAAEKKLDAATATLIVPYVVPGAYNSGVPASGMAYVEPARIYTPYAEEVTFYNLYTVLKSSWYIQDTEVATDANSYTMEGTDFGLYYLPVMKTPNYKVDDTTEFAFKDYQYGQYFTSFYAQYGFNNLLSIGSYNIEPITNCNYLTEVESYTRGEKTYDTYGEGWDYWSTGKYGDHWYGTGLHNEDLYMDTTIVFFSNQGTMYIDHLSLGIWNWNSDIVHDAFSGENDHIRLTIYPLTAQGYPDWANPIASAVANGENAIPANEESPWYGILEFRFKEFDPITGTEFDVPVTINGDFAAVLDEYNDGTAYFGFLADDPGYKSHEMVGDTYFAATVDGELKYLQFWSEPANILLTAYAVMPIVLDAPEKVLFEDGELSKTFTLRTNVLGDDIDPANFDNLNEELAGLEIDIEEDWISVEVKTNGEESEEEGNVYFDFDNTVTLTITVEPSNEKRFGIVTLNALGAEYQIVVDQNNATQGVNTIKAVNDNKTYNVLGIEVGEDYKGVVIRNGQKFIR